MGFPSDERVLSRIEKNGTQGCWLWKGPINHNGYGVIYYKADGKNGKTCATLAHRWFYQYYKGTIPEGLVLDHLCCVTCCVNPNHLEAVTNGENVLRGNGYAARHARKTHCPQGHSYDEGNTYIYHASTGDGRHCRMCRQNIQKSLNGKRKRLPQKRKCCRVCHKWKAVSRVESGICSVCREQERLK